MDGTLLDTLQDILDAVNYALKECGYDKVYTYEEGKKLIGGGGYVFAKRALSYKPHTEEELAIFRDHFFQRYGEFQNRTTKPYDGMIDLLNDLKKKYRLFVISNKPDFLLREIVHEKYGVDIFVDVIGHKEDNPEKPDPFSVNYMIKKYNLKREECLYVGDSDVDVNTAINSHIDCCLVTYGYGSYTSDLIKKAAFTASNVTEFRKLFL